MGLVSSVFGGGPDNGANTVFGQAPLTDQGNLTGNINQSYGQTQGNLSNENALAQQLLAQSQGQGPNPAQAMLNQATQQNIQSAAGTVASQKGLNPALAARLAGQQAGQMNQQAAGQGAIMGAQQQLGAQGQLAGLYGQVGQQGLTQQQLLQQALAAQNSAHVENARQANSANAGLATQNAKDQNAFQASLINGIGGMAATGSTMGGEGASSAAMFAARGAIVPGRANVPGDSRANDTVPAMLSPGEVVIPRSISHDPEKTKEFVEALLSNSKSKKKGGYEAVLKAHAQLGQSLKAMAESPE